MDFWRRSAFLLMAAGPCLAHCAPDFDALSAGDASAGRGGNLASGGGHDVSGSGGSSGSSSSGGSGGSTTSPMTGGSATAGGGSGTATAGSGQAEGGAVGSGAGAAGAAGEAGASGVPGCATPHTGQLGYLDFDAELAGEGFPDASLSGYVDTTFDATFTGQVDTNAGRTCPGAWHFSVVFKAYPSGAEPDEVAYGGLDFAFADWREAAALHVMVQLLPVNVPITGVRLYLQSGENFFYDSIFDADDFKTGEWHEMVFPLPSSGLDLSKVRRMGVELALKRAGSPGIPAEPPTLDLLLDDVWLEPK